MPELNPTPQSSPTFVADDVFDDRGLRDFERSPLWAVGDLTEQVLDLYQSGALSEELTTQALRALVVPAPDGTRWALGATTRRWYRCIAGGTWKLGSAPTDPHALGGPAEKAVADALRLLDIDPTTVATGDTTAPFASAATPTAPTDGPSLLDSLVEGFGN